MTRIKTVTEDDECKKRYLQYVMLVSSLLISRIIVTLTPPTAVTHYGRKFYVMCIENSFGDFACKHICSCSCVCVCRMINHFTGKV